MRELAPEYLVRLRRGPKVKLPFDFDAHTTIAQNRDVNGERLRPETIHTRASISPSAEPRQSMTPSVNADPPQFAQSRWNSTRAHSQPLADRWP